MCISTKNLKQLLRGLKGCNAPAKQEDSCLRPCTFVQLLTFYLTVQVFLAHLCPRRSPRLPSRSAKFLCEQHPASGRAHLSPSQRAKRAMREPGLAPGHGVRATETETRKQETPTSRRRKGGDRPPFKSGLSCEVDENNPVMTGEHYLLKPPNANRAVDHLRDY